MDLGPDKKFLKKKSVKNNHNGNLLEYIRHEVNYNYQKALYN